MCTCALYAPCICYRYRASGATGSAKNVDPTTVQFVGSFAGWVDDFELTLEAKYDIV